VILVIVRHGKAEQHAPCGRDADRRLTTRGELQARHAGAWLRGMLAGQWAPPRVGSAAAVQITHSPAVRTTQTAEAIAGELMGVPDVRGPVADDRLFIDERPSRVFAALRDHAPRAHLLVIVGHNPTVTQVAELITADDGPPMRTGELRAIRLDHDALAPDDPIGVGREISRQRLD